MSDRFFIESPIRDQTATVTGQEAAHLSKVLRARVGQEVLLFDGSGTEFLARITHLKRNEVQCEILQAVATDREAKRIVTIGVALPKGDRQRTLVEKLTELGVAAIVPLQCDRAVVQPDEQSVERLKRFVIESSKQCRRNRLLEICLPRKPAAFFGSFQKPSLRLIAHVNAESDRGWTVSNLLQADFTDAAIAIGPEGGFTDEEVGQAVTAGWKTIDLGPRILRVETAAIALAAMTVLPSN